MVLTAFISWLYHFWVRFWPYFNFVDFRAYFGHFSFVNGVKHKNLSLNFNFWSITLKFFLWTPTTQGHEWLKGCSSIKKKSVKWDTLLCTHFCILQPLLVYNPSLLFSFNLFTLNLFCQKLLIFLLFTFQFYLLLLLSSSWSSMFTTLLQWRPFLTTICYKYLPSLLDPPCPQFMLNIKT